jgi:ABC-2 type transport system ATP-binding protein
VVAQGRLVAEGPYAAIRELMDDRPLHIRVGTDRPARLAAGLLTAGVVSAARVDAGAVEVETADAAGFRRSVAGVARDHQARLTEVRVLDDDLESVFAYLVGRR